MWDKIKNVFVAIGFVALIVIAAVFRRGRELPGVIERMRRTLGDSDTRQGELDKHDKRISELDERVERNDSRVSDIDKRAASDIETARGNIDADRSLIERIRAHEQARADKDDV